MTRKADLSLTFSLAQFDNSIYLVSLYGMSYWYLQLFQYNAVDVDSLGWQWQRLIAVSK